MPGSEDNKHPDALTSAPIEEVAERVVKYIRELKPEVIITSDPIGGYRHPDHIAMHNATVLAFNKAGDAAVYPESGEPFRPQKLYYAVMPRKLLRFFLRLLPLFGQDPRRMGRNRDIDMLSMASVDFPVHASIKLSKEALEARDRATACYRSQLRGAPRRRGVLGFLQRVSGKRDLYMRAYPEVTSRRKEKDLFEGI
jgi:N-acetyl-1-D-myo-inositol-2-amino-2-deoxy-alpha-D-glucopyranoside deacetylase/mycothiol S-conjugate amidase